MKQMVEMHRGEVPKILWTIESHRSVRRLRLNIFLEFRRFEVQHFKNLDDEELGNFSLKTQNLRNATCLWSRVVALEEATISTFQHFGISGSRRSKDQNPSAARIMRNREF
jgi:hypothetical protein